MAGGGGGGGGGGGKGICEKHYFLRNLFVLVMYSLSNIKSDSLRSLNILNYISYEQSVKILVRCLKIAKVMSTYMNDDGVSAFTEHVENHFATFF